MTNKDQVKLTLYKTCVEKIDTRIREIENRLEAIREAKNNETKSSAGDKYETGRAMMQLEEENFGRQLANARSERKKLFVINPKKSFSKAEPGSLVSTTNGIYFLSIGLGKIVLEGISYFCISTDAPIGKLLLNKQPEDRFSFNQREIKIIDIE